MPKPNYRAITVKDSVKITPNMQRVTFTGDDLADFPENYESGYVKLLFSPQGQAIANKEQAQEKHLKRTYTVRAFNKENNELAIDFSLHGSKNGPAATWANSTKPGDKILMGGPGPTKLVDNQADWFLLVGDMSGLPALACNLEQLPDDAQGYAVIEVTSETDKQDLKAPDGLSIKWVINEKPGENPEALLGEIKALSWKAGNPYVWVACEFGAMKNIRAYMKNSRGIENDNIYISSYWKFDRTEEEHKVDKRIDAGAPPFIQVLWNMKTKCQNLLSLKK
ncbi:MAG: siderophore-interacting protein [Cyanobacteria bacterium P01_C01_bin.89]